MGDTQRDSPYESNEIGRAVRPPVSHKAGVRGRREDGRDPRRWPDHVRSRQHEADHTGEQSARGHDEKQLANWPNESTGRQLAARACVDSEGQQDAKGRAYPPSRDDSPSDAQQGRRLGRENRRMENTEVLDADACRDQVVGDPVQKRCTNAHENDFDGFHRVTAIMPRSALLTSRLFGKTSPFRQRQPPRSVPR